MFALTPGKPVQIDDGVWRLLALNPGMMSGPGTNTYLLAGSDSLWVLDPGPADSRHVDNILAAAAEIGLPIGHVLCTHTHRDHSPCAALLAEAQSVHCHGPAVLDDPLQDDTWRPQAVLGDGERIDDGSLQLSVISTPGHVSNHLCFLSANGMLFSGDHLINGSTVVIAPPSGSMGAYLDSLRKLQQHSIRVIAPGHGDLIHDPAGAIAGTIAHRLQREDKVLAALSAAEGVCQPADLVASVYEDVPAFLHPIAEFSLHAHLIKLAEDGRAVQSGDNGFSAR